MMDFELYKRLVDELDTMETLHLQGLGEPILHPKFFDMVAYAAQKGVQVTTNTNLTLLNAKKADLFVESGLRTLCVSLDGATRETFEDIRLGADFGTLLQNLRLITQAKKRLHSLTPTLKIVVVSMRRNLAELPDVVSLAAKSGAEGVFVQQLSHDFGPESFSSSYKPLNAFIQKESLLGEEPSRVAHFFGQARRRAESLGLTLRLPPQSPKPYPKDTQGFKRCDWPWRGVYISYQGYAMPCCMVASPDRLTLGLLDGNNLAEVWHGEAYRWFRESLAFHTPPSVCRSCSLYLGHF